MKLPLAATLLLGVCCCVRPPCLLADQAPTHELPIRADAATTRVELTDRDFADAGAIIEVAMEGEPLSITIKRVTTRNCGPLIVSRGEPTDAMRDVTVLIEDCAIDCGHGSKGVHLATGITRFTMERCRLTRCQKAAVQLGVADLLQPRRSDITIRDTVIDGVLDREGATDQESHGVFLLACQRVLLDRVTVRNVASRAVDGQPRREVDCEGMYFKARDVLVRDCKLHDAGLSAITVKGVGERPDTDPRHRRVGDRVTIQGCTITTSEEYRSLPHRGVLVDCGGQVTIMDNSIDGGVVIDQPRGATGRVSVERNELIGRGGLGVEVREASLPLRIEGNRGAGVRRVVGARQWPTGSVQRNNTRAAAGDP